jgi:hypothetical protein
MAAKPKVYKSFHDDDKENYNGARKTENRKKKHSTKHPLNKTNFSLKIGWPYKRGTTT